MTDFQAPWIGLTIGNSRYHWAYIEGKRLVKTWTVSHPVLNDLTHLNPTQWPDWLSWSPALQDYAQAHHPPFPPIELLSVVPAHTQVWQRYPTARVIDLAAIPLRGTYPTLGVDRALALWAAGQSYGWPVLVIDCGTALTVTGADAHQQLVGGAILPGLGLQLRSLNQATAALPHLSAAEGLPQRWATDTSTAIRSGILYTLVAGILDFRTAWLADYPESATVFTGGDHTILAAALTHRYTQQGSLDGGLYQDPLLLLRGLIQLRAARLQAKRVS